MITTNTSELASMRDPPSNESDPDIVAWAAAGTDVEHKMTFFYGIRNCPMAIFWSVLLSTAVVMEGYDCVLTGTFFAMPQFKEYFGERSSDGDYEIPARWQVGLTDGAQVGSIIGLWLNGLLAERFGYRKVMIGTLLVTVAAIFIFFFAKNIQTLQAAQVVIGIPWGVLQTLTTTYAAEVCPLPLRGHLTAYINLCWLMGQIIASGVCRAMLSRNGELAFRIPYALQWVWPVPLIAGCVLAPDSPWWLLRHGRKDDARKALLRLNSTSNDGKLKVDKTMAMMQHTINKGKKECSEPSYFDYFKRSDRRRTEIACAVYMFQNLSGSTLMAYSTYFYQQAGLANEQSFNMSLIQYSIGCVGTIGSWFLMARFSHRAIYISGMSTLATLLLTTGFTGFAPETNRSASWAIGSMLLVYCLAYNLTVAPKVCSLVAEIPSPRLRILTVVIARALYNLMGLFAASITPFMFNPGAWDWGAKAAIFWSGMCMACLVWAYLRLPEPRGLTFGELNSLFEEGASIKGFAEKVAGIRQKRNNETRRRGTCDSSWTDDTTITQNLRAEQEPKK